MESTIQPIEPLFANAKFGDIFKTRDRRTAMYLTNLVESTTDKKHLLILGWGYDKDRTISCTDDGWVVYDSNVQMYQESANDIISKE